MPRYGYDYREYRGRPDARHSYGVRGYQMDAGWGWDDDGGDPNWRGGGYQGMRMEGGGGGRQAPYGRERLYRQHDLGGYGGFDGRSDLPNGWYDASGYYHEQYEREGRAAPPPHSAGWRAQGGPGEGGVRYDREYLRQYNAHSPSLGQGGPRRGWGFSPGPDAPPMRGQDARGRQTEERGHAGYNTGGFAEGKFAGPGTRQSVPMQKGRR